jgi:hypothetical protein
LCAINALQRIDPAPITRQKLPRRAAVFVRQNR